MRTFGRMKRVLGGQGGFTVAEVFIGAMLMVMASMGLLSLFNSSVQLAGISRDTKDAQQFARRVSERIRALPFYLPYGNTPSDVDDFYWGTVAQHGGDITTNNWSTNPYVNCDLITDPRFTCQVKMAYVLDNLETKSMKADWVPRAAADQQGKDKPASVDNEVYNVIKYEVKVGWKVKSYSTTDTSYSYVSLMTSTQFQANLGVTAAINIDTDPAKMGSEGQNSDTAPHTANNLAIQITGYGFKAGCSAKLMKTGVADIDVTNLVLVDNNTLTGRVNLDTGGAAAAPWTPRRDPGRWTARVTIGSAFAYGYDAFQIEFPRPTVTAVNPTSGRDSNQLCSVTATGNNVLNLGAGSSPYTAYCGATIRLVREDDPEIVITPRDDRAITYGATGGYGVQNTVTAVFDLRNRSAGDYFVEIVNCANNRVVEAVGNTTSAHNETKFTVVASAPAPSDIYVTGSSGSEVYVPAGEKRHFAYRGRSYTYRVRIEGVDMAAVGTVKVGVGGNPVQGTGDYVVTASDVVADPGNTFVDATIDLSAVPDQYAYDDGTYAWWVYCENVGTGVKGNLQNAFQVRKPRPILYRAPEYMNGPGGFYHNYAGIGTRLTGECFDSSSYNIKYRSGAYGYGNQTYTVGDSDGGMVKGTPTNSGTRWETQLNLVRIRAGSRNIYVETDGGVTDNGFTTVKDPGPYSFHIPVTGAQATLNTKASGAITVTNRFHDYWLDWFTTKSAWRGPVSNTENASANALAQRSDTGWYSDQLGYATFTLRGQGFKEANAGASWISVDVKDWSLLEGSHWDGVASGNYNVPDAADAAAALQDRANKYVTIVTSEWVMPSKDEWLRIELDVNGDSRYENRVYLQGILQNN